MSELATANTELHDPERIKLLTDLKAVVKCNVSSTVHAHLWLSDIDALKQFVNIAQTKVSMTMSVFHSTDKNAKTVEKCEFMPFHSVDLLMSYRDPTISTKIYFENTFTTRNSTCNSTESIEFR
jgi:hypothetical protein